MDVVPGVLYGITDALSIFFNMPIAADYQQPGQHSAGLEDAFVQLEYAYYTKNTTTYEDQATILGSISFPTGSSQARPPTGFGSPSYLLGTTFNRTYVNWFVFGSPSVILTTTRNGTKLGDQYFYQFGLGRNIKDIGTTWIIAGMAELTGSYAKKNIINSATDPNSGGNSVFLTPSVWISSKNLVIQLGIGFPVAEHLYGHQVNSEYLLAANLGWTFS
jgi:hypothetical protein